jgi:hypothetical protein
MSLAPMYEAIRCETSGKPLIREKPAEFWALDMCKDGSSPSIKRNIYESVKTFIWIVGMYLGVVPQDCILTLSFLFFYGIYNSIIYIIYAIIYIVRDGKIHHCVCVDT